MLTLLILAVVLTLATLWWLARPVKLAATSSNGEERAELIEVRDRLLAQLSELDAERTDRGVDSDIARDEELRLSAELARVLKRLEELPDARPGASAAAAPRPGYPAVLMLAGILVAGAGLYGALNFTNLSGFVHATQRGLDGTRVPPMVFVMIDKLERHLAEHPDDADGWSRLGRSYSVLQQSDKAKNAYARAYALAPDNPAVLADYAWLVFNENPTVTTGLVYDLYSSLAKLQPENLDALWFLGVAAFQRGDQSGAMHYWELLAKKLPPNSPELKELSRMMAAARERAKAGRSTR